jgi:hypothetical protein
MGPSLSTCCRKSIAPEVTLFGAAASASSALIVIEVRPDLLPKE